MESVKGDPLILGPTRPSMKLGAPIESVYVNFFICSFIFMLSGQLRYFLLFLPIHGFFYLICLKEPRSFELLQLKIKCVLECPNTMFWKSTSYSPLPLPNKKDKED